ncbi:programmed cell death protein 2-like isoform X8 [Rhineura floridana]|uniref:programmed cell death protein 2-like isoform X8 n=1 Tax=Rhineura floridana TaxID=261503 RepID=UPI002AC7EF03|nr:programmed cell death protein 2-like isoform X8 [Rhineura floridana]
MQPNPILSYGSRLRSWKVLRSQYLQVQRKGMQDCKLKQKQESLLATKDWCEEANDWGEDDKMAVSECTTDHSLDLPAASNCLPREPHCVAQFQDLSLGDVPGVSHPLHFHHPAGEEQVMPSCVPVFQPYYISVVEEEDYIDYEDTGHAQQLLKEYQQREGVDFDQLMSESCTSDGCDEKYEKSDVEKRDQVFLKFMKRISLCREQILRYSWGGQPLFITCPSTDIRTTVPPCNNCKSKRIFEFQLMPTLVSMLKTRDEAEILGSSVNILNYFKYIETDIQGFKNSILRDCMCCCPGSHPRPNDRGVFL